MKLAAIAVFAALAATPALAASVYPDTTTVAPDPGVDSRVAMENQARQNYYQHQLEAANAQAEADNARAQAERAAAERDTALDRAADDRADIDDAER
ncbi:MAG TPA: hypothetical protein VNN98_06915 [Rhizomicrobium sp.]|nr:hypothetical protein [Rhizomicrobium sp.]